MAQYYSEHKSPLERYTNDVESGEIVEDDAQKAAILALQLVYEDLQEHWQPCGFWRGVSKYVNKSRQKRIQGLYFWGGVGRGKTYLMDLFFQCLPGQRKLRMHFHRFMRMVHQRLSEVKGQANPLMLVAGSIADDADVICFDEFFVSDIGDAMILAVLLEALFERGVVLITTSNIVPSGLYENGLQRDKFLPAIALLEKNTTIVNVDGGQDYRLRSLEQAEIYHSPLNDEAERALLSCFKALSKGQRKNDGMTMEILGRDVSVRAWSEGLAWFDFDTLCGAGRGAADYIELAQLYHSILMANVPQLDAGTDDKARRFISLVDEFYDHNVALIISAAVPLENLYIGSELAFAFARTSSRLLEMQSHDYLAQQHKP